MEKKYLVGIAKVPGMGNQQIVFDNVKNFTSAEDDGRVVSFTFADKDADYEYQWNESRSLYEEANGKAPDIYQYQVICRRTAIKHNAVSENRMEMKPESWQQKQQEEAAQMAWLRARFGYEI